MIVKRSIFNGLASDIPNVVLPFEPLVPNDETIAAMKASRRGELVSVGSVDDLLESLNAGRLDMPVASSAITTFNVD